MDCQLSLAGKLLAVHAEPLGDVKAFRPEPGMAAKMPLPNVAASQFAEADIVCADQVKPSDEVAADVLPFEIARKTPLPYVIGVHCWELGIVPTDQLAPSPELAAVAEPAATATKLDPPKATFCQFTVAGNVLALHEAPSLKTVPTCGVESGLEAFEKSPHD